MGAPWSVKHVTCRFRHLQSAAEAWILELRWRLRGTVCVLSEHNKTFHANQIFEPRQPTAALRIVASNIR